MFANKNLFDDDVDVDARGNAAYQNSRPMTGAYESTGAERERVAEVPFDAPRGNK